MTIAEAQERLNKIGALSTWRRPDTLITRFSYMGNMYEGAPDVFYGFFVTFDKAGTEDMETGSMPILIPRIWVDAGKDDAIKRHLEKMCLDHEKQVDAWRESNYGEVTPDV